MGALFGSMSGNRPTEQDGKAPRQMGATTSLAPFKFKMNLRGDLSVGTTAQSDLKELVLLRNNLVITSLMATCGLGRMPLCAGHPS